MATFKLTIVPKKDKKSGSIIRYIRWMDEKETYYLGINFSRSVILNNLAYTSDRDKVKNSSKGRRNYYVKVSELNNNLLTLYNEDFSVTICEKTSSYWKNDFAELLDVTVEEFLSDQKLNPYQRFENSPESMKRAFRFKSKELLDKIKEFLDDMDAHEKVYHPYEMVCTDVKSYNFSGHKLINCFPPFWIYVFDPKDKFIPPCQIGDVSLDKVQDKLFDKSRAKYEQNSETRDICILLTADKVRLYNKRKRIVSQEQVMCNNSANDVADTLQLTNRNSDSKFEWLHLVAHSMGPFYSANSPQEIANFVLGTKATNTLMMTHEMILKSIVIDSKVNADLRVRAFCVPIKNGKYATWLSQRIEYSYKFIMIQDTDDFSQFISEQRVHFVNFSDINPLANVTPCLLENLLLPKYCADYMNTVLGNVSKPEKKGMEEENLSAAGLDEVRGRIFEAFSSRSMSSGGIEFYNIEQCGYVGGEFIPAAQPRDGEEFYLNPCTTPGAKAFTATADGFGRSMMDTRGFFVEDGSKIISMDYEKENFTLDSLFEDFSKEEFSLFVFDNVKLNLEEKKYGRTLSLSADLRMDVEPLATMKNFLKIDKLSFSGEIGIGDQALSGKIKPDFMTLTGVANFHIPICDFITLTSGAVKVYVGQKIDLEKHETSWCCGVCLLGSLELSGLSGGKPVELDYLFSRSGNSFHAAATTRNVENFLGIRGLTLELMELSFDMGNTAEVELTACFAPGNRIFDFGGKASRGFMGLYSSAENFTVDDINDLFKFLCNENLLLPHFDVTFEEVFIGIASSDGTVGDKALQKGLTVSCRLKVFEHEFSALAALSEDGVTITGLLEDLDIGPVQLKKVGAGMNIYRSSSGKPSEFYILGDAVIEGVEVQCKACYEKTGDHWNLLLYAGLHAQSLSLSTIFPEARDSFADSLKFSKVAFVYSSADCKTQDPDFSFTVQKGLQLMGTLEEIPAISDLMGSKQAGLGFSAHIGSTIDIGVEVKNSGLKLGRSVVCDPFSLKVILTPEPALDLIFGMDVTIATQKEPLHFDLVLEAGIYECRGSGTMKHWWIDPFGVKDLKIGPELALQAGIIYAEFASTGLPSEFGFAGGLAVGAMETTMALSISEDPMHEILAGSLKQLTSKDLVEFAAAVTGVRFDETAIPDFFELKDISFYCAPAGGSIGTIKYDAGLSFSGDMCLFGKRASLYATFSEKGLAAKGHLDGIEIGPLKISGEKGKDAELDLELTLEKQSVYVDGMIRFLDSHAGVLADISAKGVKFKFEENFAGLLTYEVQGESKGSLAQPSTLDFDLTAQFDNHLTDYLKDTVARKIRVAIGAAKTTIEEAEAAVDKAEKAYQAEYDKAKAALDGARAEADKCLRECAEKVEEEKNKYNSSMESAEAEVNKARTVYDNALSSAQKAITDAQRDYDSAVKTAEAALNDARKIYDDAMKTARKAVDDATREYDRVFGDAVAEVQRAKKEVAKLQDEVNRATRDRDSRQGWDFIAIAALTVYIGGLQASMLIAQSALTIAEGVLQAVRYGTEYTALEAAKQTLEAVRLGGEYGALEVAEKAVEAVRFGGEYVVLEGAKQALGAVKIGTEYTVWQAALNTLHDVRTVGRVALDAAEYTLSNIGTSAVYLAAESAKQALELVKQGTSAVTFENAKVALEAAKHGSEALMKLSALILEHSGDIIIVRHLKVASSLKRIEAGEFFKAEASLAILGRDCNWSLDFNARDSAAFVESLFKNALEEAKKIVC